MFDTTPYQECIVEVHPSTVQKVIAVESGGNLLALNINGTQQPQKPTTKAQAIKVAHDYIQRGYSVDLGLMQVNSKNLSRYGVTVEDMFEPCANLKIGSRILYDAYQRAWQNNNEPQAALQVALSIYNTGSPQRGFNNGYVRKYTNNALVIAPRTTSASNARTTLDFGDFYD